MSSLTENKEPVLIRLTGDCGTEIYNTKTFNTEMAKKNFEEKYGMAPKTVISFSFDQCSSDDLKNFIDFGNADPGFDD